jgi:hypothetical protein
MEVSSAIVGAIGLICGAMLGRLIMRQRQRADADLERARTAPVAAERDTIPRLRRDPVTGIYRP